MNVNKNSGKSLKENSGKNTFGLRRRPFFLFVCALQRKSGKISSIWDKDFFFPFWSTTKIRGKILLSLVFNQFGITTANFLAAQEASGVQRLSKEATGHQRLVTTGLGLFFIYHIQNVQASLTIYKYPGTRLYHFYHPILPNQIGCKYICSDLNFCATFNFALAVYQKVKSMDFVAFWCNFNWWVGLILSVNEPQLKVDVKFMCPQPHMAYHHHFIGLSKMAFVLFLTTKLFAQLTLLLLHPVDKSTNFLD